MKTCERCTSWQKKYKILTAEMSFQIKKLEEDMAHQKITQHLAHQKEAQKLNDRITSQKRDREIENRKWIQKYDSMVAVYEEKLKAKDAECQKKIYEIEKDIETRVEEQKSEKETKIRQQIEQLRGESEQYKKRLLQVKEDEKKLIEKFHCEEINKTLDKFKKQKEFMEEEKEKLMTEIKELEQKDLRNKTIEIQLSEELYYKKQQTESLNEKIGQLEHTLHTKQKVLEYVRKEYNDRVKKLEKESESQKEEMIKQNKKDIQELLEKQLQKCGFYESKLQELEQKREKEIKIYQAHLEQVKALVDQNRCPQKYSNQINTLHSKLKHKEKEVQRAKADIKLYQLEIENNDQILTKFFLNPAMTNTTPDLREKKPKQYKIKNNRGSLTGSNVRSPSQLKQKNPAEHDIPYNQFQTTSLENLEFMSSSKTTKIF